jgi:hypothetical protein
MNNLLNSIILALKYNKKKIILKKSLKSIFICNKLLNANIIKNFEQKNGKLIVSFYFLKNKQIIPIYSIIKKIFKLK